MVSIILITHNRVHFLKQTIKSIFQEENLNFELIIWDNASADGTIEFLQGLDSQNIKVVCHPENIGLNAVNKAIGYAKGDYFIEMDDDILSLPKNWLSSMLNAYKVIPDVGYLATDVIQDEKTNGAKPSINSYKIFNYGDIVFEEGPTGGWCTLFSRKVYEMVGGFVEFEGLTFFGEDGDFSQKIRDKGYRTGVLRNVKAYHASGEVLNEAYKQVFEGKMESYDRFLKILSQDNLKKDLIKLSVIIVNWQVKEYLKKCLLSIEKIYPNLSDSHFLEVIVVDNASTDDSVSMVRDNFPWVRLIANLENKGFATANNQGLKISHGEYILFLNPDTEITEDSFNKMIDYLEVHKDVGALGCRIIYPNGKLQPSCRGFPTVEVAFWQHHGDFLLGNSKKIIDEYYMKNMDYDTVGEVDQPMGAVLMVKRKALRDVGGYMDDKFFMFFDEVDLCYRLKQKGWKIVYFPGTTIVHHFAKSVDFACKNGMLVDQEFHKSMFKFLWKHYRSRFIKIIILKLLFFYNKLRNIPAKTL